MKIAMLLLILPGCSTLGIPTPWPSSEEVAEVADAKALERAKEVVAAVVAGGVTMDAYQPTSAYRAPRTTAGTDWGEIVVLAITALLGTGGAIGYRALDHKRKAQKKAQA